MTSPSPSPASAGEPSTTSLTAEMERAYLAGWMDRAYTEGKFHYEHERALGEGKAIHYADQRAGFTGSPALASRAPADAKADEALPWECGLMHPSGNFCDAPKGHAGEHRAYAGSPNELRWGSAEPAADSGAGSVLTPDEKAMVAIYHRLAPPNAALGPQMESRIDDLIDEIARRADHQIPFYAYGDNEAACDMALRLRDITQSLAVLRSLASAPRESEPAGRAPSPEHSEDTQRLDWLEFEGASVDWMGGTNFRVMSAQQETFDEKPNIRAAIDAARGASPEHREAR